MHFIGLMEMAFIYCFSFSVLFQAFRFIRCHIVHLEDHSILDVLFLLFFYLSINYFSSHYNKWRKKNNIKK